jgi:hypothetical protein
LSTLNTNINDNYFNNTTLTTLSTAIDDQFELTTTYNNNNFVNNTTLTALSTVIDNQFELTTTCIDDKITKQQEHTEQEKEALRTEGYIQEALTQVLAWATSDEGKRSYY